jgi:hypothetical protein
LQHAKNIVATRIYSNCNIKNKKTQNKRRLEFPTAHAPAAGAPPTPTVVVGVELRLARPWPWQELPPRPAAAAAGVNLLTRVVDGC